jgi:WD40 repeat protein
MRCIRLRNDAKRFLTGSDDHKIDVWDVASGKHLKNLNGHMDSVYDVGWGPDDQSIVSAGG